MKFSKRRRAIPLRPIWTIMAAAKLDHSRVLVTKFRQNWLTLKGRSAGQRHTHRQTNSAENNGPSGLQSGQQTTRLVFTARLRPQFRMPPSFDRCMPPRRRFNQNIPPNVVLLPQCHCRNRHRSKVQNLFPPLVLFESSRFLLQYTGDTDAKNDGPKF